MANRNERRHSNALLKERMNRILKAVSLDRLDRVPVVLEYSGFAAAATGTPMHTFVSTPEKATRTIIEAFERIGGGDVTTTFELL